MKDQCYAALFDKKDLPLLYKLARKVRRTHNQDLTTDFYSKLQQKYDDHNPILQIGNKQVEFEQVSKADDLVLDGGIVHTLNLILGVSSTRWNLMGKGTGTATPSAGETILVTEVLPRRDMSQFGWREPGSPANLRFAGIYGESEATITVNEAGVFATPNPGAALLNRNMFSNNPITHTVNVTVFVIASIVELVPKLA